MVLEATSQLQGAAPKAVHVINYHDVFSREKNKRPMLLSDLVTTVFDVAGEYSSDSLEVSRLATAAVASLLLQTQATTAPARDIANAIS